MKGNRDMQANSFQKGLSIDPSDMILDNNSLRYAQNVRIINSQTSSFVLTNLQGTDLSFTITSGYEPVAIQEYSGVLYIISWNSTNGAVELGTFPSPSYGNVGGLNVDTTPTYRPLNNYNSTSFTGITQFGTTTSERPVIQKLEIQPDFDESVNLCFTIKGQRPRIVNSNFIGRQSANSAVNGGVTFEAAPARSGTATSNTYTTSSLEKETSLIIYTDKILDIDGTTPVETGGKLKPGNYQYVFYYMSEDFNKTSIVGQSSICQIFFGDTLANIRGGDNNEVTNKRVHLTLSNVDTDFRYLKVYVLYSSGTTGLLQQYLEFVNPIEITGTTIEFYHDGYEELQEVALDEVNIDYTPITSASASTQISGYYFLGDIKQREILFEPFKTAAKALVPVLTTNSLTALSSAPGYANPANTYNLLGYMGGETYAFGIVFIMKDGTTSPVFPIADNNKGVINTTSTAKGLVTFNDSIGSYSPFTTTGSAIDNVRIRYVNVDVSSLIANTTITNQTVGYFFVRAERRSNAIAQGLVVPTIKAPAAEAIDTDGNLTEYYRTYDDELDNLSFFKRIINFDSILEAYFYNGNTDWAAITSYGKALGGYMPVCVTKSTLYNTAIGTTNYWAFLAPEAFMNEPEYVTSLSRDSAGLSQIMRLTFKPNLTLQYSKTNPEDFKYFTDASGTNGDFRRFCPYYDMVSYTGYNELTPTVPSGSNQQLVNTISFVPGNSLATGNDFVSKITVALGTRSSTSDTADDKAYWVNQSYDSYFGVKLPTTLFYQGLVSPSFTNYPTSTNVNGGSSFPVTSGAANVECISGFANALLNDSRVYNNAYLVNIYPQQIPSTPTALYPSIENLVYKQIGKRYSWTSGSSVALYGGDCYISRVSRKLSRTPETNPINFLTGNGDATGKNRWNIDSGIIVTWWQESKYNLHLRQPYQFDASELEQRSFFPYKSTGNLENYRKIRLPESAYHSVGYSVTSTAKDFFNISDFTVSEKNRFLNRVIHSEKHIPNAFRNGYRSFLQNNFRDYDSSMGSIVGLFNYRGNLLVVFEHGIGIGGIEQRIETGKDGAGAIFVEPTSVLPPVLQYVSREIGCQDHRSLVQTPGAIYGIDRLKKKIWCFQEGLRVISDDAYIANWMLLNPITEPRSGYDLENNEVLFITDDWTLCYSEGLKRFSSFYTMNDVSIVGRRNMEVYTFLKTSKNQAYLNNSGVTYSLYGTQEDVILEFVINKSLGMTKVIDYINIISNEVPPAKMELYTYNQFNEVEKQINLGPGSNINQYVEMLDEVDTLRDEENFLYRDKKYVARIPNRTFYEQGSASDTWDVDGRIRDKVVIVRLTYNTNNPFELASILTYFRYSAS